MPTVDESPSKRRSRSWIVYLLIALVVAAGVWWYMNQAQEEASPSGPMGFRSFGGPVPVRVAEVKQQSMDQTLQAIGTVKAFNTVTVKSRVEGELLALPKAEGSYVEQGEIIARLDPRTYEVQTEQAKGQLAQTRARLENAQQDLARYQRLASQQSIARQQLESQQALVQELTATEQANQAAVRQAELQLEFTEISAPISGQLGLKKVDIGNLVSAGGSDGLMVITQTQPIAVTFSIPQAYIQQVKRARDGDDLEVQVIAPGASEPLATGILTAVDNQIDPETGTVTLKAKFDNDDQVLFPNQFVNVVLKIASDQALTVPVSALQYGSKGAFVYKVEGDNVAIQEVMAGQMHEGLVAITAGLNPGDVVVTEGVDRLREGSEIDIVPADEGDRP